MTDTLAPSRPKRKTASKKKKASPKTQIKAKTKTKTRQAKPPTAAKLLEHFRKNGNHVLKKIRALHAAPNSRKILRTWDINETARLIGCAPNTIRKHETTDGSGILGKPEYGTNKRRAYSLSRINQIRDILDQRYLRPAHSKPSIIAFSIFKGGGGKTTSAIHFAQYAALMGQRVLCVDLDPQGTMTFLFGYIPEVDFGSEATVAEVLIDDPNLIHERIVETNWPNIHLIPGNSGLEGTDMMLFDPSADNGRNLGPVLQRLDNALNKVADQFDVIVLDCGPNLGVLTYNATVAANILIIPMKPDMSAFGSCVSYTGSLEALFKSYPKTFDYFRCYINQHPGGEDADQAERMIRLNFKDHVLHNVMVTTQELQRSTNDLGTLYEVSKPKRSLQTYRRAIQHMNQVNQEIFDLVKTTWDNQA